MVNYLESFQELEYHNNSAVKTHNLFSKEKWDLE